MNKPALLLALFASTITAPVFGDSKVIANPLIIQEMQSDEIDLRGRIEPGEIRRDMKAISAFLQENEIKAQFHFDMGTVQITISNGTGTVYTTNVNSSIGQFSIPTTGLANGNYTITFTASTGVLSGNFIL